MFVNLVPIIPIFITIIAFLLSRKAHLAIFSGCVAAALLLTKGLPVESLILFFKVFVQEHRLDQLLYPANYVSLIFSSPYLFIILLNIYISLIHKSGIAYGYYNFLNQRLNSKRAAELSTIVLGAFMFIDDYLSLLTNIRVSSLFCQRFKIPKSKICFFAASLAAPICTLIPFSSWGAVISPIIGSSISKTVMQGWDPFYILINAAWYMFFSLFAIFTAVLVAVRSYSFGIIKKEEDLLAIQPEPSESSSPDHVWKFQLWHFLLPVLSLIGTILFFMLFWGNYFSTPNSTVFTALLSNTDLNKPLVAGILTNLAIMILLFWGTGLLSMKHFWESLIEGCNESYYILLLLAFSTTFGALLQQLGIAKTLSTMAALFIRPTFLPAIIFVLTTILGVTLGSAWTTILLLIPTTLPVILSITVQLDNPYYLKHLTIIGIGAIISGAVFGTSISPISDLLTLATRSARISAEKYLHVQLTYTLLVGASALVSFIVSGFLAHSHFWHCWLVSFASGIFVLIILLEGRKRLER